jgi:hypothetical protein
MMKERLNTSIQSLILILVVAGLAYVVWSSDTAMRDMLTYLIILMVFIEALSLYLIGKVYPESHTSFKIAMIAILIILLGIKSMSPELFVPLTITAFAVNFLYNFYTNGKRRKGTFRRKLKGKMKPTNR